MRAELTGWIGGLLDDGLKRIVDELAVDQEPEVPFDGRLPLANGRRFGGFLPLLGLIPGVQLHRDSPHLVDEPTVPGSPSRLTLLRRLGRGGGYDHGPQGHPAAGTSAGAAKEAVGMLAEEGGDDSARVGGEG